MSESTDRKISVQERMFTSIGEKFWEHPDQMASYRAGTGNTIISTHIAPEGACNLKCPYCSVTHRDTHSRIDLEVIQDYVRKLKTRGLKAVIITGGGEPTAYKYINELIWWLHRAMDLKVALITNGTLSNKLAKDCWEALSWVRVSINFFTEWEDRIQIPTGLPGTVGASVVYTADHQIPIEEDEWPDRLRRIARVADFNEVSYVRVLPNCLLPQKELIKEHNRLDQLFAELDDPRFFHQYKIHGAPKNIKCHQSVFRPYLSEERYWGEGPHKGRSGSVYPCDSVVLNDARAKFAPKYQLCAPEDVLDWLDGKIQQKFSACDDCSGCVFTRSVDMLGEWKSTGEKPRWVTDLDRMTPMHAEFP